MSNEKSIVNGMPPIAVRGMRMKKAIAMDNPDRVPFFPTMNNFYPLAYGVSVYDAMKDIRFMNGVMDQYLDRFSPDLCQIPLHFPIDPLKASGVEGIKWPGPDFNLPVNAPYQYIDSEFMGEDDYDEYLADPSAFIINKVLAKRYKAFKGLEKLKVALMCDQAIYTLAPMADPEIQEALHNMMHTGNLVKEHLQDLTALAMRIVNKGFIPFGSATVCTAFDYFADNIRGLLNTCMDILEVPEKVDAVLEHLSSLLIPSCIAAAKAAHTDYVFIPLHCGHETFMSLENYRNHYWPTLRQMIEGIVEAGLTPVVWCEGKYSSRLDVIKEVPKGKVIYLFEDVDLELACKKLEGIAVVASGMRSQTLMFGNKEAVIAEAKASLDIGKQYGNFIMTNTLALDYVDLDLFQAWQDTTFEYGRY